LPEACCADEAGEVTALQVPIALALQAAAVIVQSQTIWNYVIMCLYSIQYTTCLCLDSMLFVSLFHTVELRGGSENLIV